MPEIEVSHARGGVRIDQVWRDSPSKTSRSIIANISSEQARQLAAALNARADEADAYRRQHAGEEINRLVAEIAVREDRIAELRRLADAPAS